MGGKKVFIFDTIQICVFPLSRKSAISTRVEYTQTKLKVPTYSTKNLLISCKIQIEFVTAQPNGAKTG
jgi:hypothetical protein